MSKKFIIILISSVLGLLLVSLMGYYFIIQDGNANGTGGGINFRSFLPFGGEQEIPEDTGTGSENEEENTTPTPEENSTDFTQKLRKLSVEPVAGAGVLDITAGTLVRYIERATGHIYEVELFSPKKERRSNTTIPLVYDAVWGDKSEALITRSLAEDDMTVNTYTLLLKNISASTTENTLSGIAFPSGVSDVSSFGSSVFYLQQSEKSSQGFTSNFDGSKKKMIWSSEIKELNSQFVNEKTLALNTKPHQNVKGYLYLVDTGTGVVKSYLNDILGLSSNVSPDVSFIFYLMQSNIARTFVFDTKTKTSLNINSVTFPEKCVWSKKNKNILYCAVPRGALDNTSLTSWYMGTETYTDDLWEYDIKEGRTSIIYDLNSSGEEIDVIKPILSTSEQYLVFVNKKDNSLWSLDLTK